MNSPVVNNDRRMPVCAVCGDEPAKVHYGIFACFGCKGFFRRAVKDGHSRYICRYEKNCSVDKHVRNSCRFCRFRRCLQVGMNPDAVRPDRDRTGKQRVFRLTKSQRQKITPPSSNRGGSGGSPIMLNNNQELEMEDDEDKSPSPPGMMTPVVDDWTKFLNRDLRKTLVDLLNLESRIATNPYRIATPDGYPLRALIAERLVAVDTMPDAKQAKYFDGDLPDSIIATWRIAAVVDFIHGICNFMTADGDGKRIILDDRVSLVKNCYCKLGYLKISAKMSGESNLNEMEMQQIIPGKKTAKKLQIVTKLKSFTKSLVQLCPSEAEIALLNAIVAMNPDNDNLTQESRETIAQIRNLMQELLFKSIKKSRPKTTYASAHFGNYLLILPKLQSLSMELEEYLSQILSHNASGFLRDLFHREQLTEEEIPCCKLFSEVQQQPQQNPSQLNRSDHQIIEEITTLVSRYEKNQETNNKQRNSEQYNDHQNVDPFAALFKKPLQLTKSLDAILATGPAPPPVTAADGSLATAIQYPMAPTAYETNGQMKNYPSISCGFSMESMNTNSIIANATTSMAPLKLQLGWTRSIEELLKATSESSSLNTPAFANGMVTAMFFPECLDGNGMQK